MPIGLQNLHVRLSPYYYCIIYYIIIVCEWSRMRRTAGKMSTIAAMIFFLYLFEPENNNDNCFF